MVVQVAAIATGILFMLFGAISAYVSYLGIKGKIKPNAYVGVRLNVSRNYRLYWQDKYWYPVNRYGGEKTFPISVLWSLLGLAVTILPIDPVTKIRAMTALILLVTAAFIIIAWQIYRYADMLVSADPGYR